jgi:hypothetical protein
MSSMMIMRRRILLWGFDGDEECTTPSIEPKFASVAYEFNARILSQQDVRMDDNNPCIHLIEKVIIDILISSHMFMTQITEVGEKFIQLIAYTAAKA